MSFARMMSDSRSGQLRTVLVAGGIQFVIEGGLGETKAIVLTIDDTKKVIADLCKMAGVPITPIIVRNNG